MMGNAPIPGAIPTRHHTFVMFRPACQSLRHGSRYFFRTAYWMEELHNKVRGVGIHTPGKTVWPLSEKGMITVGSDADLVLWDMNMNVIIRHENLHDNCDYSPYEGHRARAWPVRTILRGETVFSSGKVIAHECVGQFLK